MSYAIILPLVFIGKYNVNRDLFTVVSTVPPVN